MGKPAGIRTARKHVKNRRIQRWADLDYKKAHLGTRWKANPFGGASHAKGIVLEKASYIRFRNVEPEQGLCISDVTFI
jgi:small subunit ribosomal protein S23e